MNLHRRIKRLEQLAVGLIPVNKTKNRCCKDMEGEEIERLVNEAIDEADYDLCEKIMAFVEEAAATPVLEYCGTKGELVLDEEGNQVYDHHYFISWFWGLKAGSWSLPEKLPRRFLEGFCDRHGMVRRRCEDCRCGLGNAVLYETCPICGSGNLSHKKLSGPPWDPDFVYTPLLLINGKLAR